MEKLKEIEKELRAFADEPELVDINRFTKKACFERFGKEIRFTIQSDDLIIYEGQEMKRKAFLSYEVAQLDLFANKIINYHKNERRLKKESKSYVEPFIENDAELIGGEKPQKEKAFDLLDKQCKEPSPLATDVTFITADAGYGKTYLLKEYEYRQAEKFIKRENSFLFWHIDLQGRSLARLDESIAGELGRLRVFGIYTASINYLLKSGSLVLAIDGFDELAAETGKTDGLSSLADLINELDGKGTIIAASRRTFFDFDSELEKMEKTSKSFIKKELKLCKWEKENNIDYLEKTIKANAGILTIENGDIEKIKKWINKGDSQKRSPNFTTPFLFSKTIQTLVTQKTDIEEFLNNHLVENIKTLIKLFIRREAKDKWMDTRKGLPLLNEVQHEELLAAISGEMWHVQKEALGIDILEFNAELLCKEEWQIIDPEKQYDIENRVKAHALLTAAGELKRTFEHSEYKNYFLAVALSKKIKNILSQKIKQMNSIKLFLSRAQLPDPVGKHLADILHSKSKEAIIAIFEKIMQDSWKLSSYPEMNIGMLFTFIANDFKPGKTIQFGKKNRTNVVFSSLIFEDKVFKNIEFYNATFINISFKNTKFDTIKFINCDFTQIKIDVQGNKFKEVEIKDSTIASIILEEGEDASPYFDPEDIFEKLKDVDIQWIDKEKKKDELLTKPKPKKNIQTNKAVRRILNAFKSQNPLPEFVIKHKLGQASAQKFINLMNEDNLLEVAKETKDGKKTWRLRYGVNNILKYDNNKIDKTEKLEIFWKKVNEMQL